MIGWQVHRNGVCLARHKRPQQSRRVQSRAHLSKGVGIRRLRCGRCDSLTVWSASSCQ